MNDDSQEEVDTWWDRRIAVCYEVLKPLVDRGFSFEICDGLLKVEPTPDVLTIAELIMPMPDVIRFITEIGDGKWPLPPVTLLEARPLDPAQELCELVSFANDRGVSMCRDDMVIHLCGPTVEDVDDIAACFAALPLLIVMLPNCRHRAEEGAEGCMACGVPWDKHTMAGGVLERD